MKDVTASQNPEIQKQVKRTNYRWTMAIFAFLATFVAYLDRVNMAVATPSIMKELHFTKVQIVSMST